MPRLDNLKFERKLWDRGFERIAGTDEAGRGPLAGPVVAAAVIFRKGDHIEEVTDSKQLSEKARDRLFDVIRSKALCYGVGIIDHVEIDKINILNASLKAMRIAIEKLQQEPDYILVDGNKNPYPPDHRINQRSVIKGDLKSFTIGAASILAKVTRDRIMTNYHTENDCYNFVQNKGYPTPEHILCIKRHGISKIHRVSFCRKILADHYNSFQIKLNL